MEAPNDIDNSIVIIIFKKKLITITRLLSVKKEIHDSSKNMILADNTRSTPNPLSRKSQQPRGVIKHWPYNWSRDFRTNHQNPNNRRPRQNSQFCW